MTDTSKTATQFLLEAADLLEHNPSVGWYQNVYVTLTDGDKWCNLCAHGAIAYCASPDMRQRIRKALYPLVGGSLNDVITCGVGFGSSYEWSDKVKATITSRGGEQAIAHYWAAKVGLTFEYNDTPTTTKQNVIDKLREAAQYAASNSFSDSPRHETNNKGQSQ